MKSLGGATAARTFKLRTIGRGRQHAEAAVRTGRGIQTSGQSVSQVLGGCPVGGHRLRAVRSSDILEKKAVSRSSDAAPVGENQ
jgi:hypothetical protein